MLAFTLLGNLLMAMFLLHKSTVTTISKLEIVHIWNKVDTWRSGVKFRTRFRLEILYKLF
jgi:hypothetical protein